MTYIGDFVSQLDDELALFFGDVLDEVVPGGSSCLVDLHLPHEDKVVDSPNNSKYTADNDDHNGSSVVKGSPAVRTICCHGVDVALSGHFELKLKINL